MITANFPSQLLPRRKYNKPKCGVLHVRLRLLVIACHVFPANEMQIRCDFLQVIQQVDSPFAPTLALGSLRCSRTCQLFLNVNVVRLRNGSRKRVHGAISHYGPRSSAWLSTWLFSCFLIGNKMAVSEEERWKRAFEAVTRQFNIENLLEEQQKSLREFLGGHNIFVNLPTGFGKSLIFQCLPIAADALFARPRD